LKLIEALAASLKSKYMLANTEIPSLLHVESQYLGLVHK